METKQRETIDAKPRLLKELAKAYGVNSKTFKAWLGYDSLKHITPEGYYYSIKQIGEIVNHLGEPY